MPRVEEKQVQLAGTLRLPRRLHHRHRDVRRIPARAEHSLGRRLKVRLFREEDVRHESLRVAIDHREPSALNLHHDPVSLLEDVIVGRKSDLVVQHRVRRESARASQSSCGSDRGIRRPRSSVDSRPSSDRLRISPDTRRLALRSSRCRCPWSRRRGWRRSFPTR